MANLENQHNFIWYGISENDDTSPKQGTGTDDTGKCLPFPLIDSGIHSAWYVNESGEKKSWSSLSSSNDFTDLVCGNSYYVKLNKTEDMISSVNIPHAVLSEQNYSAEFSVCSEFYYDIRVNWENLHEKRSMYSPYRNSINLEEADPPVNFFGTQPWVKLQPTPDIEIAGPNNSFYNHWISALIPGKYTLTTDVDSLALRYSLTTKRVLGDRTWTMLLMVKQNGKLFFQSIPSYGDSVDIQITKDNFATGFFPAQSTLNFTQGSQFEFGFGFVQGYGSPLQTTINILKFEMCWSGNGKLIEATEEPTPTPTPPPNDELFEINDLWIGFAKVDASAWSFSEFYEARGAESEAFAFELDAVSGYNQAAAAASKPKIGTGSGETMIVTQDMIDGILFMQMFLVNPWTANSKPSIEPLSLLKGAPIVKDGETFTIHYTADYSYTKFTIIDENFTTESFDFASLISHALIVKSTEKPSLSDGTTPNQIFESAFNIPNEMSLVCDNEWNYDSDKSYLVFDGNKPHRFTGSYSTEHEAKNSGITARDENKSPWLGAKMSMAANGANTFDSKGGANEALKIKEFYFIEKITATDSEPTRIKFGDGSPKGTHC